MKIMENKKYIITFIFAFAITLSAVFLAIKFIPDAISYTVSTSENQIKSSVVADAYDNTVYKSIYGIEEQGPFDILTEGENIYVFSGKKRLYRIKASLSDFPEKDKNAISSGIKIPQKSELYEMVQYMES